MLKNVLAEQSHKLVLALALIIATLVLGTVGFMLMESWSLLDALYMTVISVTTVGYKEVHDLSDGGRVLNILVILMGVLTLGFSLLTQILIGLELRNIIGRQTMQKKINTLNNHYIICGFGRIGRIIAQEFARVKVPFVIVEMNTARMQEIEQDGYLGVLGNAEDDEVLQDAGIDRAKGMICATSKDDINVFVTLTARGLSRDLWILSRADDSSTEKKLRRAGANQIVSPYRSAGKKIAMTVLKPNVLDFVEGITGSSGMDFQMVEVKVHPNSSLVGKSLVEMDISRKFGVMIIAIHRVGEEGGNFAPSGDTVVRQNDVLLVVGNTNAVSEFGTMAGGA